MKRKIFAALAISAIAFVSCKKEEPVAPSEPGTATLTGIITADLDVYNDTNSSGGYQWNPEFAPSGTVVTAVIDGADLDPTPDAGYDYPDIIYTTTIGSGGVYTLSNVQCYNTPIDVVLMFNDFSYDQITGPATVDKERYIYTLPNDTVTIYKGAMVINDYDYNW
ncbi:MAG: hypothetical protein IPM74_05440 [Crocinitomicaceae bacterium]|nr:hypothetical protein [Crocinitomicaceae bacterium]MBK8925347.1 hypothetical protein [Crocinitomicaceae bacterium]